MRTLVLLMFVIASYLCQGKLAVNKSINLFLNSSEEAILFAAKDIEKSLLHKDLLVALNPLNKLSANSNGQKIILAQNSQQIRKALEKAGGKKVPDLNVQEYAFRVTQHKQGKCYWVIGGDCIGTMYGGIHLNEIIKAFGLGAVKNEDHSPYIKKRGIKFNIPLDDRQPSHDDRGTAAQTNIPNMWDFQFWEEYLDVLARQRYNVLSLWNKHPFPSLIKLPDYPDVALDDVYDESGKVLTIGIDEKISLWKKIMDHAYNRGIEIYIITWNIHMNGARAKHNIQESYKSDVTKDYLRKSVKQLFLTYPRLAGIGVTAGENMDDMNANQKEQWLWETYGKGVQDVNKLQPERKIRFIHRFWWTSFDQINNRFGQLKDGFDMSFKYAGARIYSDPAPNFAEEKLFPYLPDSVATWWNIRNDDIYNLRWGDPEYVRQFILNFPQEGRTAGYYMGSDRYAWGRESISKHPASSRMLENEKHWYSFLLWGRMGYDPNTSVELLKGLIKNRFPEVSHELLFSAWHNSSKIIPLVNKFHWYKWDYLWWPEACISSGSGVAIAGFHNLNHFIQTPVMNSEEMLTIPAFTTAYIQNLPIELESPFEIADKLENYADAALSELSNMNENYDVELSETIGDIRAMAYLGKYYSNKIRGATYLSLFRESKNEEYKKQSVSSLQVALGNWQDYAKILDKQYHKMRVGIHRDFDWHKLENDVRHDIEIARKAE